MVFGWFLDGFEHFPLVQQAPPDLHRASCSGRKPDHGRHLQIESITVVILGCAVELLLCTVSPPENRLFHMIRLYPIYIHLQL